MYRGKKTALPVQLRTIELLTPNEEGRFVEAGVTLKKIQPGLPSGKFWLCAM